MNKTILYNNYINSLKQKYNAVCFDIDGTLTINNSKKIDPRAIDMIFSLLQKRVPVVFITGRGETGLNDLKNDILENLKSKNISESLLKRIYVLTNDGARLFYTNNIESGFLSNQTYISNEDEINQLSMFNKDILNLKERYSLNYFDITYSKDSTNNIILNIRLNLKNKSDQFIDYLYDNLKNILENNNYNSIKLSRGIYKGDNVIQIGTASKDIAIEKTEIIIGVPKNSMIRIGDCGDLRGNDYAMLNCNQGYSVDKTSGDNNGCFPIFNDNFQILKGVEATLYLIKKARILPTVCLEKADKDIYTYEYAKIEKSLIKGKNILLENFDKAINENFNETGGINDIFDPNSGSVVIPMYDWITAENSFLKQLWKIGTEDSLYYTLRDNKNYLLRGSKTYYFFLANRESVNGKDVTTKENVINWHKNYIDFFQKCMLAISSEDNFNNNITKKMVLGILDNCRNVLLVLLNHKLYSKNFQNNILLEISSQDNREENIIYQSLIDVLDKMKSICFEKNYSLQKEELIKLVSDTISNMNNNLQTEIKAEVKDDYSKDYRAYREIDNFAENFISVALYTKKNEFESHIISCGLSYGGNELPIISKIIMKDKVRNVLLLKFNNKTSGYSNKQLLDLRKFDIREYGGIINASGYEGKTLHLFDDNILTGKTLQLSINSLQDYKINTDKICIVRYPSVNRIDQMFMVNHGAVDYKLFFNYIYGLGFSSPYTWRDNNKNIYEDSLGIFDINRKKIIDCLIKNHDYNEQSEVGEYMRRFIK